MLRGNFIYFFSVLLASPVLFFSCGPSGSLNRGALSQGIQLNCVLPDDQLGTLSGKWPGLPVPLALQVNGWDAQETAAIMRAVATWNSFYSITKGYILLDAGDASSPRLSGLTSTRNISSDSIVSGSSFIGVVVVYKQGDWRYGSDVIAITSQDWAPGSPLKIAQNAMIEVNYRDYFVSGKRLPDLETIILHEFGHLIGLGHSCEPGSSNPNIVNCDRAGLPREYREALMFPVFGWRSGGQGEQKRNLRLNDQGRANCLY